MSNAKWIGVESLERVFVAENHDEAYYIWRDAGARQRVLVHVDAHHDMLWIEDQEPITVASYICPALKQDLLREVIWVVPDGTWRSRTGRKAVFRQVERIVRRYPHSSPGEADETRISATILRKRLTVCSLDSLPRVREPVLLDIDADFLVLQHLRPGREYVPGALPWCWPEDLIARLRNCELRTDLVTLARSAEGGYTPVQWKYLADEVALRLRRPPEGEAALSGMAAMRLGAKAAYAGDGVEAEEQFHRAAKLMPGSAAPHYQLAHLYLDLGRREEARAIYRQALALDASYRTPYSSIGSGYEIKSPQQSEQQCRRILALDPEDPYAHFGLGVLSRSRKHWKEAEDWFRKALALEANLLDAWRELGSVLSRQKRVAEAVRAYETYLKLALAGHKPLCHPVLSHLDQQVPVEPEHWLVHYRLGRLHQREGNTERAVASYLISIAGGVDGVSLRCRLAWLHLRRRQWDRFLEQALWGAQRVPADTRRVLARAARSLRRRFGGE